MDTPPVSTNTDTLQANTPTKRSHHKKTITAPKVETSGLDTSGGSSTKPPVTRNRQARVNPAKLKQVTDGITSLYATLGIALYARDQYDGLVVMTTAQDRAVELVNVAKHHKWLMDLLIRITQSSDYVTLVIGHGTLAYALLAHHNQIPRNDALLTQFGLSEQQVLTKAAMMQAQAQQPQETPDVAAQYQAMQQEEVRPSDLNNTSYETGNEYDTGNTTTTDNAASVHRLDESVLETR
jgi:hypothetical protein